ncbi:DNA-binding FrmR family transcriptional regulator [Breznakia sp. PF5-3]|uniref:metal-sensing transcriptional repressor n=1 Tax=unclassified Breznakia TaxID=2623764 RepID=UPI002407088A|nr:MULTISPECIES: metal-sensing transcriptional repressor [unclassified Breznakia]MDF9825106.1 DNA-binding FrmR family transcriptional regulator [Breznakia sp. PM6-1]MDF9835953.1 DNA-binding FrmR family transcriptional regulator [Breznakia sp. PF5-3]MDF9837808.1 DNA-binding FrmR family transcriptional regulator [Breznakia sp. PFB2-8]MDF9859728.1 DNA-binding FrmR family transcriptional regulator [Breznakia sp. PH5-24]
MKADSKQVKRLLKTARGQIDGVLKMIDDDKYCIDIVNQIMASSAILNKATKEILHAHINGCIKESFESNDEAFQEKKIQELLSVIDKIAK